MRIFVYEYITAQAHGCDAVGLLRSLQREGAAMLAAVTEDFRRIPGVAVSTIQADAQGVGLDKNTERDAFCDAACAADYTLVIAPECDGILLERCRWVEEAGGRLLGPSAAAVRLAGDKLALGQHWQAAGVPTPPCAIWHPGLTPPFAFPMVCKPRHGAGSQAVYLIENAQQWRNIPADALGLGIIDDFLVQPIVPGQPASVAFLIGPNQILPLPPATQRLSTDGRFCYQGGEIPLGYMLAQRAVALAQQAVQAVPGLRGYVGVDLIVGEKDQVIEMNPRLTTSYVGLRGLAESNLAKAMLAIVRGDDIPPLRWHGGRVRFDANGTCQRLV